MLSSVHAFCNNWGRFAERIEKYFGLSGGEIESESGCGDHGCDACRPDDPDNERGGVSPVFAPRCNDMDFGPYGPKRCLFEEYYGAQLESHNSSARYALYARLNRVLNKLAITVSLLFGCYASYLCAYLLLVLSH